MKRKSSSTRCRERRQKEKAAAEDGGTGGNEVLVNPTRTSPGSEVGYSFIKASKLILGSLIIKKKKKLPCWQYQTPQFKIWKDRILSIV